MGCSPYFAVIGTHSIISLDIMKATYLQSPPNPLLSTTDLITRCAIAFQKRCKNLTAICSKVYDTRRRTALRFEDKHHSSIQDFNFIRRALVFMRNTAIKKALNCKMRARYLGPLVVIARNRGRAYILCELNSSVLNRPVAAFRLVPYLARTTIALSQTFADITPGRLKAMDEYTVVEDVELTDDEDEHGTNEEELANALEP